MVRVGRRPATSRVELERVALDLFVARGFDGTTVDDIAAAAGIGRRTFFRYHASKNDAVWGDFAYQLEKLRSQLRSIPVDVPLMDAVRTAVVDFNRLPEDEQPWHRCRMELILRVPALQAHSTLRYADWRAVVAEFVAARLAQPASTLLPQLVAYTALGAALAAYEQWLADPASDLTALIETAMDGLAGGFGREEGLATTPP